MQFGKVDWKFGLQQSVAAMPDRLVRRKPVESFSPNIPELDRPMQLPHKHRLIGQREQIGQAFWAYRHQLGRL
jgi:hypothetical protein